MLYHVILSNILALFEDIKNNNCGIDSPYDLFSVNHILQEHSKDIHKTQQCDIKKKPYVVAKQKRLSSGHHHAHAFMEVLQPQAGKHETSLFK